MRTGTKFCLKEATTVDEPDEELWDTMAHFAERLALPGDRSWESDLNELVRLYDLREANANEWWTTPEGSEARQVWNIYNGPYMDALRRWEWIWKLVVGNHARGNQSTYEAISDALKVKELESQFTGL